MVDPMFTSPPVPPRELTTETVHDWAIELGIDDLGVCLAEAYSRAEDAIDERRARGLFADLKFTMARTATSCHPESLVQGAASVISTALCYWAPDADPPDEDADRPHGRIGRYTRTDAYTALTERLKTIAEHLRSHGHEARVLVDSNDHVDREAAIRSGVGFSGKHTNVITRRHGSWVVLGTIVTDAPLAPTAPMRPGCGSCTLCIDACPTDAIVDGGLVLDTTRCISYWGQSRHSVPTDIREAMGDLVYGCDICQEACPWNRGVESRRANDAAQPWGVDLVEWLEAPAGRLDAQFERFFVPRRDVRYLRRNALIALGNSAVESNAALIAPFLGADDAMLREHAAWALRRLGGPIAAAALAGQV